MEINEFAEMVREAVQMELGTDYRVGIKKTGEINGIFRNGLVIWEKGKNMIPVIYLESFLDAYEAGKSLEWIAGRILYIYLTDTAKDSVDMEFFRYFELVRNRICYRLVGRKGNEALLSKIPHVDFLDLAVCFYYAYQDETVGEGSILIYNSHLEMWGTDTEVLFRSAQANTPELFPRKLCSLRELVGEKLQEAQKESGEEDGFLDHIPMKVLTNSKKTDGASSILYPGVLEEVAGKLGGNFYILPCSLHEVICLPDTGLNEGEKLKEMIAEINAAELAPEDVLSDSLYYYNTGTGKVEIL